MLGDPPKLSQPNLYHLTKWTTLYSSKRQVSPQDLGKYRSTFCPGARPAAAKPPPSSSVMGNYSSAAVAVDGEPCAQVGM